MSKHSLEAGGKNSFSSKKFCSSLKPDPVITENKTSSKGNIISISGEKFIDTEGGFLVEEKTNFKAPDQVLLVEESFQEFTCLECKKDYYTSFLYKNFEYPVCDGCKDSNDKHTLITRTDAKKEYLLKDCDLDKREPLLKFIERKNPHNVNWGQMKLYLRLQVEKRAIEIWESLDKLDEEFEAREEKRMKSKIKKYNKNIKSLRMEVRSSLFNRTSGPAHQHEFGPETYDENEDVYRKECLSCKFVETYEKM